MVHPNEDIIRLKLKEMRIISSNRGKGVTNRSLRGVTMNQLIDGIENLLDDKPRPLHVALENFPNQSLNTIPEPIDYESI